MARADQAIRRGELDEARDILTPVLGRSCSVDVWTLAAYVSLKQGRLTESLELLKLAEGHHPAEPKVWLSLATVLNLLARPADEVEYRRKLVFLVPNPSASDYVKLASAFAAAWRRTEGVALGELGFISTKLDKLSLAGGLESEVMTMAQALYQFKPLTADAIRLFRKASPTPEGSRDLSVGWVRMDHWCAKAGLPIARASTDLGMPGFRPMLAELRRVTVLPNFQWLPVLDEAGIALDGFLMHRLKLRDTNPESPLLLHRHDVRSEFRLPTELPVLPGPALLLGGMPQYYHQTVEFLGTLAVAETMGLPEDVPLVVNDDLAPFQLEQFSALGISPSRLIRIPAGSPVKFERLWVATRPVRGGRWIDPLVPAWFRRRLSLPAGPGLRKLYLTRAGTARRRIRNEAELIDILERRGFEVVQPESLSVQQQIALFSEAGQIVAPAGAALTNMLFSPPGARIVGIYNGVVAQAGADLYFDALALACGHNYLPLEVTASRAGDTDRLIDADIHVPVESLEARLDLPILRAEPRTES